MHSCRDWINTHKSLHLTSHHHTVVSTHHHITTSSRHHVITPLSLYTISLFSLPIHCAALASIALELSSSLVSSFSSHSESGYVWARIYSNSCASLCASSRIFSLHLFPSPLFSFFSSLLSFSFCLHLGKLVVIVHPRFDEFASVASNTSTYGVCDVTVARHSRYYQRAGPQLTRGCTSHCDTLPPHLFTHLCVYPNLFPSLSFSSPLSLLAQCLFSLLRFSLSVVTSTFSLALLLTYAVVRSLAPHTPSHVCSRPRVLSPF